jgi:hypothetical protein
MGSGSAFEFEYVEADAEAQRPWTLRMWPRSAPDRLLEVGAQDPGTSAGAVWFFAVMFGEGAMIDMEVPRLL